MTTTQDAPVQIPLAPACKDGGLLQFYNRLKEVYEKPVMLDATDINEVFPSLLMQAVLCAERDWQQRDIEFSISNLSDPARDALNLLGLTENHFKSKDAS